jgi:hypothetical protein
MADEQEGAKAAEQSTPTVQQPNKTEEQVATRLSSPIASRSASPVAKQPAVNRWRVVSVTLGAGVAMFGLMFTILRGR